MSEFLARGYNVAVPEVDVGDDVLVIRDATQEVSRVQVKSSRLVSGGAQFKVSRVQLETPTEVPLWYVFAVSEDAAWKPLLLISRMDLADSYAGRKGKPGTLGRSINFKLRYRDGVPWVGGVDARGHEADWSRCGRPSSPDPLEPPTAP